MKAILIAATSLMLSSAALAQTAPAEDQRAPVAARDAVQEATDAISQISRDMGNMIATAADEAAEAAHEAEVAAQRALDSAQQAIAAAEKSGDPPDVSAPSLSAAKPGILGSWLISRRIWTTNEPSAAVWDGPELAERPEGWQDIAKVDDIVMDGQGNVVGYIADIGGFLGIGARKVLLGTDAIHLMRVDGGWLFVTGFTKSELEALPAFDAANVLR